MSTSATTDARRHKCPSCGKTASAAHAPFCSQGCRDRDLLKWLGEGYRLPGPLADGAFGGRDRDD